MRKLLSLLFILSGMAAASAAHATPGTVDMSWDVCAPVVTHKANSTAAAPLNFSVLGNSEIHNSYQVRFLMSAADRTTPDAWRFDAAGCQTDALISITSSPPAALVKSCPQFKGASPLEIKNFALFPPTDPNPYLGTQMRGLLAVTYTPVTAVPTTRYFLGQFLFDHTFSVSGPGDPPNSCGGNDIPVCFAIIQKTSFIEGPDPQNPNEILFDIGNNFATYGPTPMAGCPATPARAATWGQIKNQYRD
jgi:hypothetical protein